MTPEGLHKFLTISITVDGLVLYKWPFVVKIQRTLKKKIGKLVGEGFTCLVKRLFTTPRFIHGPWVGLYPMLFPISFVPGTKVPRLSYYKHDPSPTVNLMDLPRDFRFVSASRPTRRLLVLWLLPPRRIKLPVNLDRRPHLSTRSVSFIQPCILLWFLPVSQTPFHSHPGLPPPLHSVTVY